MAAVAGLAGAGVAWASGAGWLAGVLSLAAGGLAGVAAVFPGRTDRRWRGAAPRRPPEDGARRHGERRQAQPSEAAAAESRIEQEMRLIYAYSPDVISRLDLAGRWLFISPQIEEATGLPPEHFLGRRIDEVGLPSELVETWTASMRRLQETGQAHTTEWTYTGPDGMRRHYEARVAPIFDGDGTMSSFVVITRDVTERWRSQEERLHWQEVLSMALEAARAGAWEYDVAAQTSIWSGELRKLLGVPDAPEVGSVDRWLEMVHPDDREKTLQHVRHAIESGVDRVDDEYRMILPDGQVRHFYDVGRVIRGPDGAVERIVGFQIDVTDRVVAARKLREEVAFRSLIIERATEGICVCRTAKDGSRLLFEIWNPRMREITGCDLEEVNRLGWTALLSSEDADGRELEARIRRGEEFDREEVLIRNRERGRRIVLVSSKRIERGAAGDALLMVLHDVTDERRAVMALVESEERYRSIVENCLEGIWTIDTDGKTTYVNRQMAEMLGYSVDAMLGRHLFDFMDEQARAIAERNLERRRRGISEKHDFRLKHRDGRNVWTRMATAAVRGADGEYVGALAIVTDITRLREAELEAERTRALLRASFEASPVGIVVAEAPGGRILMANSAAMRLAGIAGEAVSGRDQRDWQLMGSDGAECAPESYPLAGAIREGVTTRDRELLLLSAGGEMRWVLVNAAPVFDPDGEVMAGVMVLLDISERIAAENEVRQLNADLERRVRERTEALDAANKELEGFSYSVSHDLRAPLRGIDGWSLALLEDCGEELSERAHEYLERIRSESQRMGQLIDDLLRLARVSRGRFHRESVDLSALAARVARRVDEQQRHARPAEWVIAPGLRAECDERLMEIALENLFANARKFSAGRDTPRIEFGANEGARGPEFFVRDNGAGFDMAYADQLFRPFRRLHSDAEFAGTGIGLATVQRVVRRHGGVVRAEGAPECGATFFFTLS